MLDYNNLIKYFDDSITHYKELLIFENQKLDIIISENVIELSHSLSREQALIMQSNALEYRRIEQLKDAGLHGAKFNQIIEDAPKEYTGKLKRRYNELSKYIYEIKRINNHAMQIVKGKLSDVEVKQNKTINDTYDVKGGKQHSLGNSSTLLKNV